MVFRLLCRNVHNTTKRKTQTVQTVGQVNAFKWQMTLRRALFSSSGGTISGTTTAADPTSTRTNQFKLPCQHCGEGIAIQCSYSKQSVKVVQSGLIRHEQKHMKAKDNMDVLAGAVEEMYDRTQG